MIKIYYFSGTGNTLWSAKQIAQILGSDTELYSIAAIMREPPVDIEAEKVIILFPAYAYGAPLIVRRFLLSITIRSPYIAALVTFGTDPGGALAEVYRLLRRGRAGLSFAGCIPSVENYIPIFGPPSEETKAKRLSEQQTATEEAARAISAGKTNRIRLARPLSVCISALFKLGKRFFVKGFKINSECNGCGVCAKICPSGAVSMHQGKPVFASKCEHCQACLNWCPNRGITYIRLKPDTPRYHHPNIEIRDMFL